MNLSNKARLFSDVVSLSTWRTPFDGESGVADVHADVFFGQGRIGAEASSPVRFRLALRYAEIHLIVPEVEPLKLMRGSIDGSVAVSSTKKIVVERELEGSVGIDASTTKSPDLSLKAHAGAKKTERTEREEVVFGMQTVDRPAEQGHCWIVTPAGKGDLKGRPWDQHQRKASVKLTHPQSVTLPPTARFEVRCRREDLVISDIMFKDETATIWDRLTRNKQETVICYLQKEMTKVGLMFEDLDDPYGVLVLADDITDE